MSRVPERLKDLARGTGIKVSVPQFGDHGYLLDLGKVTVHAPGTAWAQGFLNGWKRRAESGALMADNVERRRAGSSWVDSWSLGEEVEVDLWGRWREATVAARGAVIVVVMMAADTTLQPIIAPRCIRGREKEASDE